MSQTGSVVFGLQGRHMLSLQLDHMTTNNQKTMDECHKNKNKKWHSSVFCVTSSSSSWFQVSFGPKSNCVWARHLETETRSFTASQWYSRVTASRDLVSGRPQGRHNITNCLNLSFIMASNGVSNTRFAIAMRKKRQGQLVEGQE